MVTTTQETQDTQGSKSIHAKILTSDFWIELIVKQGIPAAIALYLVYNMSVRQENALQRLNDNITSLSIKIEGMRVR